MKLSARINKKRRSILIEVPLQKAAPSKSSGKTWLIASSHGCKTTEAVFGGRPVVVTVNAFIYPSSKTKSGSKKTPLKPLEEK